jgi:mediator of RNA polymerase II transcription subunit 12
VPAPLTSFCHSAKPSTANEAPRRTITANTRARPLSIQGECSREYFYLPGLAAAAMENATSRAARHPYTVPPTADAIKYGSTSHSSLSSFIGGSPCPETKIRNSRRKRHHGFAVQLTKTGKQSVQAPVSAEPQFVKPPKPSLYRVLRFSFLRKTRGIRGNRGTRRTRQKQIQLQPSKAELNKNNASRRDKLKPYVLEPTPQAKRYPQSSRRHPPPDPRARNSRSTECCDFYPWKGNHPEDRVTDYQAKHGHSDRLLYNKNVHTTGLLKSQSDLVLTALQREQLSARQFLGPAFKHRNGLPWLSYLYKDIMSRRQQHGTVTTPSTFKPPPRVTLPEQKREAWLRDLANPLVPLRKLSRTIPHGLKGPPLLEQCTAKNIPTARAVWFVRCVGANELRGLRRKGVGSLAVGGESKWIKEWTGQLAQFLEKTVGACMTMPDDLWRSKMHYS